MFGGLMANNNLNRDTGIPITLEAIQKQVSVA
jgi:hypothetical protein